MIIAENKQLQALAMIDGALAKKYLAEQLREEAEREFVQARMLLDELKEEVDGCRAMPGATEVGHGA